MLLEKHNVNNNTMKTRSQTKSQTRVTYEVNIDFDEASTLWKLNKKSVGNGCYKYICGCKTKTGNICKREKLLNLCYCKIHQPKST